MVRFSTRNSSSQPLGLGGRLFIIIFGLIFAGAGFSFLYSIGKDALIDLQPRFWQPTEATIVSNEVVTSKSGDSKHRLAIRYQFEWDGETHTSDQFGRKPTEDANVSNLERLVTQYPAGAHVTCYVNPDNPAESVIRRGRYLRLLGTLFSVPFIAIGLGCIYLGVRREKAPLPTPDSSMSSKATSAKQAGCLVIFFGIFALFGVGFLYGFFLRPVWKIWSARDWVEVPCVVEASQVHRHSSDDGATYSVDVLYRYEVNGRVFRANRYSFATGSSSGRDGKSRVVRQYPPGRETICFVDPSEPTEAVLNRGFTPEMWFGLIPLVFLGIGVGGIIFAVRKSRKSAKPQNAGAPGGFPANVRPFSSLVDGERVLKAKQGPWLRLFWGIIIAGFWNGIVSVFVWQAFEGFRRHRPEWFLTVFLIPFVLIGLAIIGYVIYAFLGLFNPRPKLRLRPAAVRLGENLACDWAISGAVGRIRKLTIQIEGIEEARYRRGTTTYTDKSVFARLPVVDSDRLREFATGGVTAVLPTQYVPSFKAPNNRIYWQLKLHGEIARWPDISEEYEIEVLPSATPASSTISFQPRPLTGSNELTNGDRLKLSISAEDGAPIKPGGRLSGSAEWNVNKQPKSIRANLLWFTRGKGTTDAVVVDSAELPTSAAGEARFGFNLPGYPLSFDGVLISLCWAVELVVAPGDESVRVEFNLGFGDQPVRLEAIADSPINKMFQARSQWNRRD